MIEDDARAGARARGRHDAQEFPKSQNREIHNRLILLCGAILAAFHTNFLRLIRIQRSHGLIPGGNMKQGVKFWRVETVGME